jgi:uncharacterized protein YjbI with pentapeptide repeats
MSKPTKNLSKNLGGDTIMSIQKKSLISTLKTAKKANIAKDDFSASPAGVSPSVKHGTVRNATVRNATVRNATVRNATVRNATVRNATVRNPVKKA